MLCARQRPGRRSPSDRRGSRLRTRTSNRRIIAHTTGRRQALRLRRSCDSAATSRVSRARVESSATSRFMTSTVCGSCTLVTTASLCIDADTPQTVADALERVSHGERLAIDGVEHTGRCRLDEPRVELSQVVEMNQRPAIVGGVSQVGQLAAALRGREQARDRSAAAAAVHHAKANHRCWLSPAARTMRSVAKSRPVAVRCVDQPSPTQQRSRRLQVQLEVLRAVRRILERRVHDHVGARRPRPDRFRLCARSPGTD